MLGFLEIQKQDVASGKMEHHGLWRLPGGSIKHKPVYPSGTVFQPQMKWPLKTSPNSFSTQMGR
jgi:hypothetical protein